MNDTDDLSSRIRENLITLVSLGIPLDEARSYDMDDAEIVIEGKKREIKQRKQERAYYDYILAQMIGQNVGLLFGKGKAKIRTLREVYPDLFNDNTEQPIEQVNNARVQQTIRDECNFLDWAATMNAKGVTDDERE